MTIDKRGLFKFICTNPLAPVKMRRINYLETYPPLLEIAAWVIDYRVDSALQIFWNVHHTFTRRQRVEELLELAR
jgi:hypothetical protein